MHPLIPSYVVFFVMFSRWPSKLGTGWYEGILKGSPQNQSILKEINPEYSLEGLMLQLKLHNFGHLVRKADSLEKTLMLGKIEGRMRRKAREDEMVGWHRQLNGHESEQTLGDSEGQESLVCCSPWVPKRLDLVTEQQQSWLRLNISNTRDVSSISSGRTEIPHAVKPQK